MRAFEYVKPGHQGAGGEPARRGLGADAEILAGGTDLLSLMKDEVAAPRRLVNIKDIDELRGIRFDARAGLRIGALVTFEELADDAAVARSYPALAAAVSGVDEPADPQRGNGGRRPLPAAALLVLPRRLRPAGPGPERPVPGLEGDNRYHAILGNEGPAYFVSPSSLAPALIALGATVRVFGPKGAREMPVEKFFRTPKSASEREHDLRPNEIVTEIRVPAAQGRRAPPTRCASTRPSTGRWPRPSVVLESSGGKVAVGARRARSRGARPVALGGGRGGPRRQGRHRGGGGGRRRGRREGSAGPERQRLQDPRSPGWR